VAARHPVIGALVGASVPEERVKEYESRLKADGIAMRVKPRTPEESLFRSRVALHAVSPLTGGHEMDAIQFLKQEHQKAKAAFAKVLKATPESRGELWAELQPELEAHEQMEDACLYAPLSRDAGKMDSKLADWPKIHQNEVDKVDGLIEEVGKLDSEDASWLTKLKAVHATLESHIREEEQDIFPRISKVWDDSKLKQAGTEMKEMKAKKLTTVR
jgi:Hemerythrin HHE cation binding domain